MVGLMVVHLRSVHMQSMYKMAELVSQERELRQQLWQQQAELSSVLESPVVVKKRVSEICESYQVNDDGI